MEEKGAHYVMEVKKNQPNLYEALEAVGLDDYSAPAITHDKGHGRIERRVVRTSTVLNSDVDWPYLGQIFRIERHVTDLDGSRPRDEVVFGITDLTPEQATADQLGAWVRGHWGIENRLHWVRDIPWRGTGLRRRSVAGAHRGGAAGDGDPAEHRHQPATQAGLDEHQTNPAPHDRKTAARARDPVGVERTPGESTEYSEH